MLPITAERVPAQTAGEINRRMAAGTGARLRWHARHAEWIAARIGHALRPATV